jgi:hypothetical protein
MSTETDDKAQSKFPRASLRARNKTLMITPADVADYQVRTDEHPEKSVDLEDVFEDSLSAFDEAVSERGDDAGLEVGVLEDASQSLAVLKESAGVRALTDVWDSDDANDKLGMTGQVNSSIPTEDDSHDIFAAPAGVSTAADELFGVPAAAEQPDPIIREIRSAQGPALLSASKSMAALAQVTAGAGSYDSHGGSALQSAAQEFKEAHQELSSAGSQEYVDWKKKSKLVGFLVSYAVDSMGRYIELREGRLLVTSGQTSTDSCFVIAHETVSPMHAIMRISADGSILILDQLSEHGTRIQRGQTGKEEALMGDKSTICHGDVVIFGECEYHVVVMGAAALKREA